MQSLPRLKPTAWLQASLVILTINLPVIAQESATDGAIESYKNGDLPAAISILEKVVKKNPEDADAWYYLGRSYFDLGLFAAAEKPFEHVVDLRPALAESRAKLAFIVLLANDTTRAVTLANKAKQLGDDSAQLHYVLSEAGLRSRAKDAYEAALREAQNALRIDPHFSLALLTAFCLNAQLGHKVEAAEALRQFIALNPVQETEVWEEQLAALEASNAEQHITAAAEQPRQQLTFATF